MSDVCCCIPDGVCSVLTTFANILLTPFLLAAHFMRIYMFPAFSIVGARIIMNFCCTLNFCKAHYYDFDFPPRDQSVGILDKNDRERDRRPHSINNLDCWSTGFFHFAQVLCFPCFKPDQKYDWVRGIELSASPGSTDSAEGIKLFQNGVDPSDICQGKLGDCWLLAVMAACANRKGLIESLFISRDRSECGYYKLRLYDIYSSSTPRWVSVTIDDKIPCAKDTKTPLFAQPSGRELWVLLLEKAFAKLMGSYGDMEGGHPVDAMRVFTGHTPVRYKKATAQIEGNYTSDHDLAPALSADELFKVIEGGAQHGMVMSCARVGSSLKNEARGNQGLHVGHAYSLLQTHTLKKSRKIGERYGMGTHLVKLRNPWGGGEWTGAFGDNDTFWKEEEGEEILKQNQETCKEDGCFWMPVEELYGNFNMFDLCASTIGLGSLELDVHEDMGLCGPCYGCLEGSLDYCILCRGARRLWCPESRTTISMILDFKDGQSVMDRVGAYTNKL